MKCGRFPNNALPPSDPQMARSGSPWPLCAQGCDELFENSRGTLHFLHSHIRVSVLASTKTDAPRRFSCMGNQSPYVDLEQRDGREDILFRTEEGILERL